MQFDYDKLANELIQERISFFEKDMNICLQDYYWELKGQTTHAYFPALMLCFANLEFMGRLYGGEYKDNGKAQVQEFVKKFMDGEVYSPNIINVLWVGFRHKIAHLSHPEYVYIHDEKRITWVVDENEKIIYKDRKYQHMQICQEDGFIKDDIPKPYPVSYTHRIYISLPIFKSDIQKAMQDYLIEIKSDKTLLINFEKIMNKIFPKE